MVIITDIQYKLLQHLATIKSWLKPIPKSREYLIDYNIDDQAFSPSNDLAPSPSPTSPPLVSKLFHILSPPVRAGRAY
jgi:hypothetical protein